MRQEANGYFVCLGLFSGGVACVVPVKPPQPDEGGQYHGDGEQLSGGDGEATYADDVVRYAEVFCKEAR